MISALLLLAGCPASPWPVDRVDWIERNTVVSDKTGEVVLEQWIFWEHAGPSRVVDWRPARGEIAERCADGWRLRWHDCGRLREVRAASLQRTWTWTDPEVEDRRAWPQGRRRGIR